jgi:uncharacterized protein YabE (DUF348 family)/3D (Asp-Asp-Asp) domain-containing protein
MQKRPGSSKERSGKGKHSHSYGNGILYTAKKRSATYNDIIPVSEQKKKSFLNDLVEGFLSRIAGKYAAKHKELPAKLHFGRHEQPAKEAAAKAPGGSFFKDKGVLLTSLVCIAVAVTSMVAVPIAFAKNEVSVNLLDSGRTFTAQTSAQTVGEFLEKNNIELGSQDLLDTSADLPIEDGMDIIIRRAMPLKVNAGTDTKDISMIAGTVSEALHLAGVNLGPDDEVYPSADSYVRPGMSIDFIDVQVKFDITTKTIGYKEVTREDDDMLKGDAEIVQYGEEGEMETKTKQVYKNGVLYSQEVVLETVTKEPVNEVKAVGTKVIRTGPSVTTVAELGSGGPTADQIREVRNMQATAYWGDTMTSTGNYPRVASGNNYGTVAADPNVLPYGTMLYIPGYGYGRVEDTGGFIHWPGGSNVIDLFMSNADVGYAWGRRNVTVYVLK